MISSFSRHQVLVDSVSLSNPKKNSDDYLVLHLQVFPFGQDGFNRTGITTIGFELSNQTFKPPPNFGPFFFIGESYNYFEVGSRGSHKQLSLEQLMLISGHPPPCKMRSLRRCGEQFNNFLGIVRMNEKKESMKRRLETHLGMTLTPSRLK
ncbi:PREDICTED: probable leucine-rich repeat receptor-like protein kinase At5g49770 isoform X1 [Nicotiana attenuata]|uniref:probable leucine-rich repeat receptor-like protein kinase At5g49770 isoform X1 n=1 Tax=Nicotiana attenuata TaxID=49451 RepID=UPI000904DD7F|nr:PREDICTED: probable leucine-rich repeat receptor-like protein kinase At5g49770 isoform X1 [Nicotiana attenuata]